MAYPLVLFDLDGTLVDSFEDIRVGLRAACAAIGVPATDGMLALVARGAPLEDYFIHAVGAMDRPRYDRFAQAYTARYLPDGCMETTRPFEGVVEVLRSLRGRTKVGIATTKKTVSARRILDGTGLAGLVDGVFGCDDIPHKPDPAVLRRAASALGVPVEEAVMIGDTDRDLGAARAAGCDEIGVAWGGFSADELAAAGAKRIARKPSDLLEWLTPARGARG